MSVHQAILAPDSHNSKPSSPAPESPRRPISLCSLFWARFSRKTKKDASILVQYAPNYFGINEDVRKIASEKRGKTSKIDPNSTFFDPFRAFSGTFLLRHIIAQFGGLSRVLAPACTRYGQGRRVFAVGSRYRLLATGYWLLARGLLLRSWLGLAATPLLLQPASSKKSRRGQCRSVARSSAR
jgi:hypothetical protein